MKEFLKVFADRFNYVVFIVIIHREDRMMLTPLTLAYKYSTILRNKLSHSRVKHVGTKVW